MFSCVGVDVGVVALSLVAGVGVVVALVLALVLALEFVDGEMYSHIRINRCVSEHSSPEVALFMRILYRMGCSNRPHGWVT